MNPDIERRVEKARSMLTERRGTSIRFAASAVGLPESTLRYHLNGQSRSSGANDEEDGLLDDPSEGYVEIPVVTRDYTDRAALKVYPLGDVHLGSPAHAEDRWEEWLAYLRGEAGVSLMLTGDLFNAALKDSKSEAYDDVMTVGKAIKVARRQLAGQAIDVMIPGNHEARVYRATGIDPVEVVADAIDAPYARATVLVRYLVGDQEYHVYLRHGTGNAGGAIGSRANQLQRGAHVVLADIHVSGHTHSQLVSRDTFFYYDAEQDRMVRRKRLYLASGSFLNYEAYAAERGYVAGAIGAPRIYLDGRKHDAHVSI